MTKTEDYTQVEICAPAGLRSWLEANHAQEASVWLVTWKKDAAPEKYVSRDDVLDELIAFGWIDGIRRKLDDSRTMQLIAPRKTQHWAKSYKVRAARLEAEGRMHAAGQASIAEGKANGLWSIMDDVDALIVPDDLAEALADTPTAEDFFHAAAPSYRRNVLRWLKLAKTEKTRANRVAKITSTSARAEKIPQM
ncbi:MAG: YdeI/OmpD-associated family protein [Pseudomonadota bacterium]